MTKKNKIKMLRSDKPVSRKLYVLLVLIFLPASCTSQNVTSRQSGTVSKSLIIYQKHNKTILQDAIDASVMKSFDKAHDAIQYAVNSFAEDGGEIIIKSGKYTLEKQINLKSNVTLRGSGSATELWIGKNHDTSTAISCKRLDRTIVCDLAIKTSRDNENAKTGIEMSNCGDCKIKDIHCLGLSEYGVLLRNNSFLCEIRGCTFAGIGKSAICLEKLTGKGRGGDFVPNLVTNCIIYAGNKGIECDNSIVVNFVGCQVYQTKSYGFHLHHNSNSILISGCRTFQIQDNAVVVDTSNEINITGNIFCWHEGHGIVLDGVTWGTITGNNVIDTGHINIVREKDHDSWTYAVDTPDDLNIPERSRNGIFMTGKSRGLTVSGNAVFNWGTNLPMRYGILEEISCSNNVISSNNINYCLEKGVYSQGENSICINNFSEVEKAYIGGDSSRLHRYDIRRIQKFIESNR